MDELNSKISATRDESLYWAQAVGLYGYNVNDKTMYRIHSSEINDHSLSVAVTHSVLPDGAATEAKQNDQINNQEIMINFLNDINDSQYNAVNFLNDINDSQHNAVNFLNDINDSQYNAVNFLNDINDSQHNAVNFLNDINDSQYNVVNFLNDQNDSQHTMINNQETMINFLNDQNDSQHTMINNQETMINFLNDQNDSEHTMINNQETMINFLNDQNDSQHTMINNQETMINFLNDQNDSQHTMINVLTDINDGLSIKGNTSADGSGNDYNILVDANGHLQVDVLSGGGGGVQYNDGDALGATPTGTVILGNDAAGNASVLTINAFGLEVFDSEALDAIKSVEVAISDIGLKITECNTCDVTVTSTVLAAGAANDQLQNEMINVLTDINDGLTIKGNTSADGSGNDYNILVDANGHLQVDVLSGGGGGVQYTIGDAAPDVGTLMIGVDDSTGAATSLMTTDPIVSGVNRLLTYDAPNASTLSNMDSTLSNLDTKITSGAETTLTTAQQVLIYGEVTNGAGAGELHPLHISQTGDLQVEIAGLETTGQEVMANSLPVVIASDQSAVEIKKGVATTVTDTSANDSNPKQTTSIDLDGTNGCVSFFGNNPNTGDQISVQFSANNSNWYTSGDLFIQTDFNTNTNDYAINLENLGVRYVRLSQTNDSAPGPWVWTNISSVR